jgi:putative acetyltransferase
VGCTVESEHTPAAVIRPIQAHDDAAVAAIIRQVRTEFGAVGGRFSVPEPEVDAMHAAYPAPAAAFFVVESEGRVLGCGGMGPLPGGPNEICELSKMYFLSELRGLGLGTKLLAVILDAARQAGYRRCYLETLGSMSDARRLYLNHGFKPVDRPLGNTGHSGCNAWMIRDL